MKLFLKLHYSNTIETVRVRNPKIKIFKYHLRPGTNKGISEPFIIIDYIYIQ